MDVIRILLADDHPVVRDGIRNRLDREEDLTVVGEAANGEETIRQARRSRPDVVLLDVAMPGPGAVPVMEELRQAAPSVKVLVLSAFDDDEYVFGMLAAGATGNLDSTAGRIVVDLMTKLARRQGSGVVIVTHDNRILDVADRVLYLSDSSLVDEVAQHPI